MPVDRATLAVRPDLIRLAARPRSKAEAIEHAAHMLVAAGCVEPAYLASMQQREELAETCLGHGVAIPHGLAKDRALIRQTGIAVLQIPEGIPWNEGQTVHLVVAIAAQSDTHIVWLRRLTRLMQDQQVMDTLFSTGSVETVLTILSADPDDDRCRANDKHATARGFADPDLAERFSWVIDYPNGLHARPATSWAEAAKAFSSQVIVRHNSERADAKSLVALLRLGLRCGDQITVSAQGQDASAALARLRAVMTGLSQPEKNDAVLSKQRTIAAAARPRWQPVTALTCLHGVAASPGLAVAPLHVLSVRSLAVADCPQPLIDDGRRLDQALTQTREALSQLAEETARRLGHSEAAIFKAHAELLTDHEIITFACHLMVEGHGVAWAWHQAIEQQADRLAAVGNPLLASRAADLRDAGRRVLAHLDPNLPQASLIELPSEPVILVAPDLSPSETIRLDHTMIAGLVTAQGGPTSHTAILARTLGIPAVVAADSAVLSLPAGGMAILDGDSGCLYLHPTMADIDAAHDWQAKQAQRQRDEKANRARPALTTDGHPIDIAANVSGADQVPFALDMGAEGVGLMRTEMLFLEREQMPDEDEQYQAYRALGQALGGRPLIIRALDIGGDKHVPYLGLPREQNPFLGVRGARLLLRSPDLREPQLRALYRAAMDGTRLSLMFPMITSVQEIQTLKAHCDHVRATLGAPAIPIGVMIEVPAAALMADLLAAHVDFFSIGTNDLTQYTLAMDRQHPDLAAHADSLHPAVLRMIKATVTGARSAQRWVGVCGGLAGDLLGSVLLLGLGVDELSMAPRDIPAIKSRLRTVSLRQAQSLAEQALSCHSAEQVRALEETLL